MEPSLTRYIWKHTRKQQLYILIVLLSMIPYFMSFDLPKQIVNGPIQGKGFESPVRHAALHADPLSICPISARSTVFPRFPTRPLGML